MAPGKELVVMVNAAGTTLTGKLLVAVWPFESVTVALTVNAPTAVGVPVTEPLDETENGPPPPEKVYGGVPPEAPTLPEYATPTCPSGSELVVMVSAAGGAGAIVTLRFLLAVWPFESVTVALTLNVPAVSGVPVTEPLEETASPPPPPEKVYGGVPPDAPTLPEYATPTCPSGSDAVVIVSGAVVIVTVCCLLAVFPAVSLAVIVKVNVPAVVGVPESVPSAANVTPGGSEPEAVRP